MLQCHNEFSYRNMFINLIKIKITMLNEWDALWLYGHWYVKATISCNLTTLYRCSPSQKKSSWHRRSSRTWCPYRRYPPRRHRHSGRSSNSQSYRPCRSSTVWLRPFLPHFLRRWFWRVYWRRREVRRRNPVSTRIAVYGKPPLSEQNVAGRPPTIMKFRKD